MADSGYFYSENEKKEMDKEHARPLIVEGTKKDTKDKNRQFAAVANEEGLKKLVEDGHLTKEQHELITKRLPLDKEKTDSRYVIQFEGPDAGHLKATRIFSGAVHNYYNYSDRGTTTYLKKTLNLTVDKPVPQAASEQLIIQGSNDSFTPGTERVREFLDSVERNKYAQNDVGPDMQRAIAQAADSSHQPARDANSALPVKRSSREPSIA